nr:hypothetical protein [Bradyrhizobium diazoefficiens]
MADGIWLMRGQEARIERRTLAALRRCSARGSRYTAMEMERDIC